MSVAPCVFVVDDQPAMLRALSRLLALAGFEVAVFESALEFLNSGNADGPGCLVLDLAMPGMDGIELQKSLAASACLLPIIFLTGHGDIDSCVQAMKFGAFDFLTKPFDGERLLWIVRAALERNRQSRLERLELDDIAARFEALTPRERQVLSMVVEGKLNKEVAAEMGTVEKTVKFHRAAVMTKMKAHSLAELVRLAERLGFRGPDNGA
jgi:FixJ family two-component response regulator